ncbi:MAG: ComF family protein [Armatimonadetes bacterium]|nr:ComF family protein [Armatimonadota bacterium]
MTVRELAEFAISLPYPPVCALCGLDSPSPICDSCRGEMVPASMDLDAVPSDLDSILAVYAYESRARQAIRRLKYHRQTALAAPMGAEIAQLVRDNRLAPDVVVPVPIHWSRAAHRGFNQATLLCRDLPFTVQPSLLRRVRRTRSQAGLSQEDRRKNLDGAFRAQPCQGLSVLLVDDVFTSGETMRLCSQELKRAGASVVMGVVYASGRPDMDFDYEDY